MGPFHILPGLSAFTGEWAAWPHPLPAQSSTELRTGMAVSCIGYVGAGQGTACGGGCWSRRSVHADRGYAGGTSLYHCTHAAPHSACTELPVGRWGRAILQRGRHMEPHAAGLGPQNHPGTQHPAALCSPCLAPRCPSSTGQGRKHNSTIPGLREKVLSSFLA